jgi:glycosyltransferase involved in cell wall biosynthesis
LKIILISSQFPNNKFPTQGIFNLSRVQTLIKLGHEVVVISPIGLTPKESNLFPFPKFLKIIREINIARQICSECNYLGIKVYHPKWFWLPRRFFWKYETQLLNIFSGRKIKKIVQTFQPDIIITSWFHPFGSYSRFLEKYFSGKIYSISEGSDLLIIPFNNKGWKSIEDTFNSTSSHLIFVSKNQKHIVEKKLNLKKGFVIENGFNTDNFYYQLKLTKKINESVEIISVGNLYPVKGFDLLLKAMLILNKNFKLTIMGDGFKKDEYIKYIEVNNLKNRVKFVGRVNNTEIIKYLSNSDIYCQPSRSEGFPAGPLEAMACGLPVVLSDVGGMPDMIIDNFNGVLFENENIDDLVKKLIEVSEKRWEKEKIASWAKKNYSWDKWAQNFIKFHDENFH